MAVWVRVTFQKQGPMARLCGESEYSNYFGYAPRYLAPCRERFVIEALPDPGVKDRFQLMEITAVEATEKDPELHAAIAPGLESQASMPFCLVVRESLHSARVMLSG